MRQRRGGGGIKGMDMDMSLLLSSAIAMKRYVVFESGEWIQDKVINDMDAIYNHGKIKYNINILILQ